MDNLDVALKEVVRHLSDGEWHSIFSIHQRFRIYPNVILECVEYLRDKEVLELKDREVRLLNIEREDFVREMILLFKKQQDNIPNDEQFSVGPRLGINELYLPRFEILDDRLKSGDL